MKHHPQQPDDKLRFLSDIIVLKGPFDSVLSFGDLILAVGLCDVAYNASRKPKRRGTPSRAERGRTARSEPLDLTRARRSTLDAADATTSGDREPRAVRNWR